MCCYVVYRCYLIGVAIGVVIGVVLRCFGLVFGVALVLLWTLSSYVHLVLLVLPFVFVILLMYLWLEWCCPWLHVVCVLLVLFCGVFF